MDIARLSSRQPNFFTTESSLTLRLFKKCHSDRGRQFANGFVTHNEITLGSNNIVVRQEPFSQQLPKLVS